MIFLGGSTSDTANGITLLGTIEIWKNSGEKFKHPLKEETPELTLCNMTKNSNDSLEDETLGVKLQYVQPLS